VRQLLFETPVDPVRRSWSGFKKSAALLWRHRTIGDGAYRMIDLLTQSAYDYLSAWFEHDTIKCLLRVLRLDRHLCRPEVPGTAYVLMHHLMGEHQGAGAVGVLCAAVWEVSRQRSRAVELALACKS